MNISYDPSKLPDFDPEHYERALQHGLRPINIICDEDGATVGEETGVSFIAFVTHVPRIGEIIKLQDNTSCVVKTVIHKVARVGSDGFLSLYTNVYAVKR